MAGNPQKSDAARHRANNRRGTPYGAKSAFIRSHPDLPAKEVVARARAAGIKLTTAQVYGTRSYTRKSGGRGPGRPRGTARATTGQPARTAEAAFKKLVIDLGVRRARELLDDVEHTLRRLVEG